MSNAGTPSDTVSEAEHAIAWEPDDAYRERSRTLRFMQRHGIGTYDDLLARAVDDPAWYWGAVADDLGLVWSQPYQQVLDLSGGAPWAEWFTGGGFNYVTTRARPPRRRRIGRPHSP